VNTEDRVMAVLASANPMPDDDSLELDTDGVTYLATLEKRSSEVTQLDTRPPEQDKSSRWTLVAVAAAAVVILGTALILLTRDSDEVATDPPPTTIVTPTTTPEATEELSPELEEALAVATAFTEARRDRDIEKMKVNAVEGHINGFIVSSLETMPSEFAWLDAIGWDMEVKGCEVTNPELSRTTIRCDVIHNNTISQALGEGPFEGAYHMKVMYAGDEKLGVPITETTVSESLQIDFPSFQFTVGTWRPFVTWVEENYPQDIDTMLAGEVQPGEIEMMLTIREHRPSLSQESIDLWRQHAAEFVAQQS
jgi:hypothetical protein